MGEHEVTSTPKQSLGRTLARHAMHPVVHIITLVSLHVVAFAVVEKTSLLTLLFRH
jgi:hypothetical protein